MLHNILAVCPILDKPKQNTFQQYTLYTQYSDIKIIFLFLWGFVHPPENQLWGFVLAPHFLRGLVLRGFVLRGFVRLPPHGYPLLNLSMFKDTHINADNR